MNSAKPILFPQNLILIAYSKTLCGIYMYILSQSQMLYVKPLGPYIEEDVHPLSPLPLLLHLPLHQPEQSHHTQHGLRRKKTHQDNNHIHSKHFPG